MDRQTSLELCKLWGSCSSVGREAVQESEGHRFASWHARICYVRIVSKHNVTPNSALSPSSAATPAAISWVKVKLNFPHRINKGLPSPMEQQLYFSNI